MKTKTKIDLIICGFYFIVLSSTFILYMTGETVEEKILCEDYNNNKIVGSECIKTFNSNQTIINQIWSIVFLVVTIIFFAFIFLLMKKIGEDDYY